MSWVFVPDLFWFFNASIIHCLPVDCVGLWLSAKGDPRVQAGAAVTAGYPVYVFCERCGAWLGRHVYDPPCDILVLGQEFDVFDGLLEASLFRWCPCRYGPDMFFRSLCYDGVAICSPVVERRVKPRRRSII